jgi:hypothetical protein
MGMVFKARSFLWFVAAYLLAVVGLVVKHGHSALGVAGRTLGWGRPRKAGAAAN